MENHKSKHFNDLVLCKGDWLWLTEFHYVDEGGIQRKWEGVTRVGTRPKSVACDGVVIVATLKKLFKHDCLILCKEYRAPMKKYVVSFPGGLIDEGESVEQAALREMWEETGYKMRVKSCSPYVCSDPAITDTLVSLVTAEVDGDDPANINPTPHLESITVLLVPKAELLERLNAMHSQENVAIENKLYTYAMALADCRPVQLVSVLPEKFNNYN